MRSAIIVFPGSNCDKDLEKAIESNTHRKSKMLWHKDVSLPKELDVIFIPGGFSFGDYLRCGAIAANSPIMESVVNFANRGGYVVGICNGFQILTEVGLLKGTLIRNSNLRFVCKLQKLSVTSVSSIFTSSLTIHDKITLPIAHHDGNYYANDSTLEELEDNGQITFKYNGNPNGSKYNIAGVTSKNGRILGMMPHPERAIDNSFNSNDGSKIFHSIIGAF
jgi:phosphoribosylformylglycinamidine synthase I